MGLRLSDYLGYYVYFVDGNNVLKSVVVIVTQLCKYTKNKWTHMLCELISAKLFYEKLLYLKKIENYIVLHFCKSL